MFIIIFSDEQIINIFLPTFQPIHYLCRATSTDKDMTFAFYPFDKQEGVPPAKQKPTPLRLVINHRNKQYRKMVGISVRPADFKKQRCKDEAVNSRLKVIEARLNERLDQFSTEQQIKDAITYALTGEDAPEEKKEGVAVPNFWDYFDMWASRGKSTRDRKLARRRVEEIAGGGGNWEDINLAWYVRFSQKCDELGLSENYKATLIAKVKSVLIEGYKLGYHTNQDYKQFKYKWETADTIALTQAEVNRLWKADLAGRDAMARDLFILGIYTASRFQNYSRLSESNIVDGMIQFVQPKTGDGVLIPLSPRVKAVLERNGGEAPKMTEQELGRRLKEICKNLGGSFLETYDVRRTQGGKVVVERKAKWEKVSAHTARRTGATILHLAGVPDYQLMRITGHRTLVNFQRYLKIGKEENARLLAKIPFFKK